MEFESSQGLMVLVNEFVEQWKLIESEEFVSSKKGLTDPEEEKFIEKLLELVREVRPDTIVKVPNADKKAIKEAYNTIRKAMGIISETVNIQNSIWIAHDWHRSEDLFEAAALRILIEMPYFDPDGWLKKMFEINPLTLAFSSRLPGEINNRLLEATYCYVYGFYNAAGALCRSVLEGRLKEYLTKKGIDVRWRWTLGEVLKFLEKGSYKEKQLAIDIKVENIKLFGNKILHELENVDERKCYSIINDTRKLLEELV